MNISIIRYILGYVLKLEAAVLMLPALTSVFYREREGVAYIAVALLCVALGILMSARKPKSNVFYLKEGCITTALAWIVLSIFGALPFVLTKEIPNYINALFETVSGFTTTGASILSDVEALSHTSLMWRSFTHWIGGMGVLVFLLAIVPLSGGSHINLMRAESPGPSVEKLVPKVRYTARLLYLIYFGLTVLQMILLLIGKMPLFEAVTTAFGTAGTGGFGIKNDSMASYSPYIQWVVTVFMALFGINFNAYYLILMRRFKKAFAMEEVRAYIIIIAVAVITVFADVSTRMDNLWDALRHSAFQVSSIITTTGFATADFDTWSQTSRIVLVMLMFVGACAGSTGGGIKVSRLVILVKTSFKEMMSYIHPKSIRKVKMDSKPIDHEVVRSINVYFITFTVLFAASMLLISFEDKDLVTTFTAVAATINNIGPGLGLVGPTGNFGSFNVFSKLVLIFDMLAGRLELFPLLLLFHPTVWKGAVTRRKRSGE